MKAFFGSGSKKKSGGKSRDASPKKSPPKSSKSTKSPKKPTSAKAGKGAAAGITEEQMAAIRTGSRPLRRCPNCTFWHYSDLGPIECPRCGAPPFERRPIVGANWKCNPEDVAALDSLVANINACDTSKCDVYVCPSTLHIGMVYKKFTSANIAAQNCNFKGCGAYTGEMAVEQMKAMGIKWVLLGHSERRGEFGLPTPAESNELLATKLKYALSQGLKCVFCIGESLPVREQGIEAVLKVCAEQLEGVASLLDPKRVVVAYEPVWSIGTGVTASPEQAQETHAGIRAWIADKVGAAVAASIRIQYGGSANAKNAAALAACPDVDGFLVGGASLKPEFADICAALVTTKGMSV